MIIRKWRTAGKWIEFWVDDNILGDYDKCCKTYMLHDAIKESGLQDYHGKYGAIGLKMIWQGDRPIKLEVPLNLPMTFDDMRQIQVNLTDCEPHGGDWYLESFQFLDMVADKYAHRYHLKMMESLQHIAPY